MIEGQEAYTYHQGDRSAKAYDVIKDKILEGRLVPGEPLVIVELATELSISRTPVKDAINRLCSEGIVQAIPKKGYFVTRLEVRNVEELMDASLVVQLGAAERGIRAAEPGLIAQMWRLTEQMDQLIDDNGHCADYPQFVKMDRDFHLLLVGAENKKRCGSEAVVVRSCMASRLVGS